MNSSNMKKLREGFRGNLKDDLTKLLKHHSLHHTIKHSFDVASESERIARFEGVDVKSAYIAGLLHDVGAIIPIDDCVSVAQNWGIKLLQEEIQFPMIIHQRLSETIAKSVFRISDDQILDAISCHTTLRAHATQLDKTVFIADKIKWDQIGIPPYYDALTKALDISLDEAVSEFLEYLIKMKEELRVVHPWLVEAYSTHGKRSLY